MNVARARQLFLTAAIAFSCSVAVAASKNVQAAELNSDGEKALAEYSEMLASVRARIKKSLPKLDPAKREHLLEVYAEEKGTLKQSRNKKPQRKNHTYNNSKASMASVEAARPVLADIDGFLGDDGLDAMLARCSILARATPRGLAEFVQRGRKESGLIEEMFGDQQLLTDMVYAGWAKAGRCWKSMEILSDIRSVSPRSRSGMFRRLAIATALELAAPELCGYKNVDPVKRYMFFEKSFIEGALHSAFDKLTIWQYRQVINDPHTEEDMVWMREMLSNYRPDFITVPDSYRFPVVGLAYSEFGHKRADVREDDPHTRMQQFLNRGGQCGPKAFFTRCLGRAFGLPVWGARLRSHTAVGHWTPRGWTTILGVSWRNGFWTADRVEPMRAHLFKLQAMAREHPDEYMKVCRIRCIADAMGEEKLDLMYSGTAGLWNALALNKMRAIVVKTSEATEGKRPWEIDTFKKEDPQFPEEMTTPAVTDDSRRIVAASDGTITVPAVACTSPTTNTPKIVFIKGLQGDMRLHYKRKGEPEAFTYTISISRTGDYRLTADVVTVNSEMYFLLAANGGEEVRMELPYTVGRWGTSRPITLSLRKGANTLTFRRTFPSDVPAKKRYAQCGPDFGGITIRSFALRPAR